MANTTDVTFGGSYDPAKHNIWQLQKLSHTKIPIISPFFYLYKLKQINKGGSFEDQICL